MLLVMPPPPESMLLKKVRALEVRYGLDKVPDETLIKIARHKKPDVMPERWAAIAVIVICKLPYPVWSKPAGGEEPQGRR